MTEREAAVVCLMEKMGGSFVKALAGCFGRADRSNFLKLRAAFPEYWSEYEGHLDRRAARATSSPKETG